MISSLVFFFLGKKEPKTQGERLTPILFSLKNLRSAAEKIIVHTLSPKAAALLPTYDKCVNIGEENFNIISKYIKTKKADITISLLRN